MRTLIIQSHSSDVHDTWMGQCLVGVERWAESSRFDYRFYGDEALLRTPDWYREKVGNRGPIVADLARLLAAAQLLGVATGARDLAVDYAKIREQFGQPIGTFQAIKHHTANMTLGIEMVSALLDMAAIALYDGHPDAGFQVAALTRLAPRIALDNARTGIQIHGGIGFSAEANAHLFFKQAHVLAQFIGPADLLSLPAPLTPYGGNA